MFYMTYVPLNFFKHRSDVIDQLPDVPKSAATAAWRDYAEIVVAESREEACQASDTYAPEHLCLLVNDPWQYVGQVKNAGGIFIGEHSFEVLGDYVAGPSHVMPTGGTARFASPVNVNDFVKLVSIIGLNETTMQKIGPAAETLANIEGLTAHAAAVTKRLQRTD